MNDNNKYEQIGKKLSGELTEPEQQEFEAWLADSTKNRALFKMMKEAWAVDTLYQKREKEGIIFEKVQKSISQKNINAPVVREAFISNRYLKYAAVIIFLLLSGIVLYEYSNQDVGAVHSGQEIVWAKKNTSAGQKSRISLPDGTIVHLNADSKLKYPIKFDKGNREVSLIGEAYFEVAHDTLHPFIVNSDGISTRALGTTFNVKTLAENKSVEVALAEGRVVVGKKGLDEQYYLEPGQEIIFKKNGSYHIDNYEPRQTLGWKDGIIFFSDATLEEVLKTLEKWYGVTFELSGNMHTEWQYSGEFQNEYLDRVLQSMAFTQDFTYNIQGKRVLITFD